MVFLAFCFRDCAGLSFGFVFYFSLGLVFHSCFVNCLDVCCWVRCCVVGGVLWICYFGNSSGLGGFGDFAFWYLVSFWLWLGVRFSDLSSLLCLLDVILGVMSGFWVCCLVLLFEFVLYGFNI